MNDDYSTDSPRVAVLKRGIVMLVFAFLFELGKLVLGAITLIQFLWMLVTLEKNAPLAEFGESLGKWLAAVARHQSGASDDRPFPWSSWDA